MSAQDGHAGEPTRRAGVVLVEKERLAVIKRVNDRGVYYLFPGGVFGTGAGAELASPPGSAAGTYTPVWVDCRALQQYDIRPAE